MKYSAALILATAAAVSACNNEGGNFFCNKVQQVKYTGLVTSGTYQAVTKMDSSGTCNFTPQTYSGPIAPFDEELSIHLRGPVQLKSFAAYIPAASKKREEHKSHRRHGHGHQHLHKKHAEAKQEEERGLGDMVTAVIDGKTVSWANAYGGSAATSSANAPVVAAVKTSAASVPSAASAASAASPASQASTSAASKASSTSVAAPGDYQRIAYYNAASQTADGCTFLGNHGGDQSGVFDTTWGSSLSYLSADGTKGAASPQCLANTLVGDNIEYSIWTSSKCADGDASCGYSRPGSVAYHGFAGANKVFLFEFQMPSSGKTGFNMDMPAIWALNAKVARTGQYSSCSCWKSNCGEADFFEVLAAGDTKAKSTFHFANALGSSDYFARPTTSYIKIAAVFQENSQTAAIKIIDDSVDFATSLSSATVGSFIASESNSVLTSVMNFLTGGSS